MPYLVVVLDEGELAWQKELGLGDVQAILPVEELHNAAVAVSHSQVILNHQTLQVLDHTPERHFFVSKVENMGVGGDGL